MVVFSLGLVGLAAATYFVPAAEAVRPWLPGEKVPLVGLVQRDAAVREDAQGELVVQKIPAEATPADDPALVAADPGADPGADPAAAPAGLPLRPPAVPTPLVQAPGAMDHYFQRLAMAEGGYPGAVVRALHWGDSTIAGDGITGTVRDRLQARFGDAGPGFLAVAVDPRWSIRPGIARWTDGDWSSLSITFGGADSPAYGLAGTVATATGAASATLGGRKREADSKGSDRQPITRFDLYYQRRPGGGSLSLKPRGASGATVHTDSGSERVWDDFLLLRSPQGSPTLWLKADGTGPVTIYGVALETEGPGLTWESFGVAGSGQGSFLQNQSASHLRRQVERRQPDLVVLQTGGNELGYPSLQKDEGAGYANTYAMVLQRLRAGAPDASCLVVTPLDQATRERGQVLSKPLLSRMVEIQRRVALEQGCAFWDARAAMGGEGAFARWLDHEPRLAWTDLMHLTDEGVDIVGQSMADAIEGSYDDWKRAHPDQVPAPYVLPTPVAAPAPVAAPTTAPAAPAATG